MKKALVILSGGQDSTTCLFWAVQKFDEVHAISFDYGQKHKIELDLAKKVAQLAGVRTHEIIKVPNILKSMSPLVSDNPLETYTDYDSMDKVIGDRRELTFVPMRNALFLTIAANRAELLGIENLITGVCQLDNANYDDCRSIFIACTESYINHALGHDHRGTQKIKILTPLIDLTKAETVELAIKCGAYEAMKYTHTCYAGVRPPCGECHSCVLRAQGFKESGHPDPLVEFFKC